MRYGLFTPGGGATLDELVSLAREAERAGFHSFYVAEAYRSAFVPLSAIAVATSRIEIGSYIVNAAARAPLMTAMSTIDLDELSGGRVILGVGSGNPHINADWFGIPHSRPLRKMEEYVTLLKRAMAASIGEPVQYEGEIHRLSWMPAVQPQRSRVPVVLAGGFPRMMKLAARLADGVGLIGLQSTSYLREVIRPRLESAAVEADRDPRECRVLIAPFLAIDDDLEAARRSAREAIYRTFWPIPHPYIEHLLNEQGYSEAVDACRKLAPQGELERAIESMPDEMIDELTVSGPIERCRSLLKEYEGLVDEALLFNSAVPQYQQHRESGRSVGWLANHEATIELGRGASG